MVIARKIQELKDFLAKESKGREIGFVPTMGDLHEGHFSLIRRSKRENNLTVLSIFVNPIQFDRKEDYEMYRRQENEDMEKARDEAVDLVFLPGTEELYPALFETYVEVGNLTKTLCGAHRPGHFRGVATIVLKLFNLVQPARAYFGMKDYQQYRVIERMARDFHLSVQVVPCPIVREKDGLAMSSRNRRLSIDERKRAATIFLALQSAARMIQSDKTPSIRDLKDHFSRKFLLEKEDRIEYFETVHPETLLPVSPVQIPALLAAAVWIGHTRLIDNFLIEKI